jgi:hypothetical protein
VDLRAQITSAVRTDVIHTPLDPPDPHADLAHTDIAIFGSAIADLKFIRTFLQRVLKVLPPGDGPTLATSPSVTTILPKVPPPSTQTTTTVVDQKPKT